MNILVCAKHVPEVAEADLEVLDDGLGVEAEDLVFDMNEWDLYAVEAALQLVEAHGGQVTVVSMGDGESEDTVRRGMAMGAEGGVNLADEAFVGGDGYANAAALAAVAKRGSYDLILTGVAASDDGLCQTGPVLAHLLGLPHSTMVTAIYPIVGGLKVKRELEAGMEEEIELPLPCLLSIQSGINEPRYVSVMGIRKVRKKPLEELDAAALGLVGDQVGASGSRLRLLELLPPPAGRRAEMIEGGLPEQAAALARILAEKGGLK